ncbi:MAG: lipoprotein-releasing system transmembrane subunit LolC [SAR86 cluster bacterium]|uniref:Lipoprotein-releasing system transmembrane subunit LolC n=1 Tax=SAR86 cluster bacterium TaxID=2030880 RepID=A0A2A5AUA2_9GAMM|nr:MAG: lipoprotein-releasing system transmembrane subunit LolC [SAR86 cluster bacterium]
MSDAPVAISRYIAFRYVSVGKRSHLVSFMSAISIFGLALGIAVLIIVLSVMNGFDYEMRQSVLGIVPHITISSDENISEDEWIEIEQTIKQHPQVLSTTPVIQAAGVAASPAGSKGVAINGIDASATAQSSALGRFMRTGSLSDLQDTSWGIIIGDTLAKRLNVSVGGKVDLFSPSISMNPITPLASFRSFTLVGVFKVGSEELDSNLVMINLAAAKALFRIRSPYNALTIRTSDVLQAEQVRLELGASLPNFLRTQSWVATLGGIYQNIQFSRSIISFMLWLLIGVAAFNLVVSLIMIVRDKRGDIAILRTLGASPATINHIFMWQGCLIGLLGIAIGVTFGVVGSLNVSKLATFIENQFSIQLLNAEVYPIDFLPSQLSFVDVLVVAGGVLILSLLATLYPAKRAAAIQPAEALRSE